MAELTSAEVASISDAFPFPTTPAERRMMERTVERIKADAYVAGLAEVRAEAECAECCHPRHDEGGCQAPDITGVEDECGCPGEQPRVDVAEVLTALDPKAMAQHMQEWYAEDVVWDALHPTQRDRWVEAARLGIEHISAALAASGTSQPASAPVDRREVQP